MKTSVANPVLSAEGVSFAFGAHRVLEDVELEVSPGEFTALVGPNGAGKSTLLRIVLGLLAPEAGRVEIFGAAPRRRADRRRLGYVPQRPRPAPDLPATVEEVVAAGRLAKQGWWRRARPADRAAVGHALESVALEELRTQRVVELSGGQQQRVLIAKALASEPELLILDEPIAGVGASAPLIGTFLVQKRLSLLGDGIGHVAVAGVGAGLLFGTSPVWTALVVAVAAALALEWLRSRGRTSGDLALALFFYGGIAAGVVLAGRSATNANLQPYLFGSILTVTENDVYTVVALGALIILAIGLTCRGLLAVVLDEEAAHVAGIPVGVLNALLAALTAVTVAAAMRVTGVLLVAALMVLPVATSRVVARSFRTTTLGAGAVGMVAVVLGLAAARQWALAAGGAIVLVAVVLFTVASIAAPFRRGRARDDASALLSGPG